MKHLLSLPISCKRGKDIWKLVFRDWAGGLETLQRFCCVVLFIFFPSSCSAGQQLRRSILTLVSHTYQKHFALGISLLPQSWSPFFLYFPFEWKDTNYSLEILHGLVWRALHWAYPNLSITAIQEQLQITFVIRAGSIRWVTDVWEVPDYGNSWGGGG